MSRPRRKVVPIRRPPERVQVVVHGPTNPEEAEAMRKAIVRDLAGLAIDLLADGRLPPSDVARSGDGNS